MRAKPTFLSAIYKNRVQNWLQEEVFDRTNDINDEADACVYQTHSYPLVCSDGMTEACCASSVSQRLWKHWIDMSGSRQASSEKLKKFSSRMESRVSSSHSRTLRNSQLTVGMSLMMCLSIPIHLRSYSLRVFVAQAMDLLDQEASEDEGMRQNAARSGRPWTRPASYEVNVELTRKERRYRGMLDQASQADDSVREKWDEWEEAVSRLAWEEVRLLC